MKIIINLVDTNKQPVKGYTSLASLLGYTLDFTEQLFVLPGSSSKNRTSEQ
jgi:hypothetical protein